MTDAVEMMDARFLVGEDEDDDRPWVEVSARQTTTYELNGYLYEMPIEPKCKTCRSPYRAQTESAVVRGYSYAAIERALPDEANLSWRNISDHFKNGHMPLRERAKRLVVEERAKELNLDVEKAEKSLIDHITLAKASIQRVFERMQSGEIEPDMGDAIQFARLLVQLELELAGDGGGLNASVLRDLLMVYSQVIGEHCDDETMAKIREDLYSHPVLAQLRSEQQSTLTR